MKGAFPPSSIDAFLIVGAHWPSSSRPPSVDPVKLSFLTSGLPVSSPPIARDPPVITLNSPAGSPASSASAASASAEKGVSLAGFRTTTPPAPSARANLRVLMADGQLQGVLAPTTPTGRFSTTHRLSAACEQGTEL